MLVSPVCLLNKCWDIRDTESHIFFFFLLNSVKKMTIFTCFFLFQFSRFNCNLIFYLIYYFSFLIKKKRKKDDSTELNLLPISMNSKYSSFYFIFGKKQKILYKIFCFLLAFLG